MPNLRPALFCLLFIAIQPAWGQPPRGPLIVSPQVHDDNRITFRFLAPAASDVKLAAQFLPEQAVMSKDSAGIWSVTVGPVKPDIYPYNFVVNGMSVMDPANVNFFPNERFKASLVDVMGKDPLIHSLKAVPHGTVSYEYYPSLEGTTANAVVYTPPGYTGAADKKYPVFYLVSGTTDTEETFFKVGRTNLILDNLIASGAAVPMIVVMPYGNPAATIAAQKGLPVPADPIVRDGEEAMVRAMMFEKDLLTGLIPYIEKNYRVKTDRLSRAIGGFSRGGGQTLRAGFGNMDKFAWICCYSAYLSTPEMQEKFSNVISEPEKTNKALKLLWVSVGEQDFLYKPTIEFIELLKQRKVTYKSLVTPGGHTWMNVKHYVAETVPLLFK